MGEQLRFEGAPTCRSRQVTSKVEQLAVRNSASICWNVYMYVGSVNFSNTYYRFCVCGASESFPDCDLWEDAEKSFYKNKHDSVGPQIIHVHPARVMRIARAVNGGTYTPKPGYCFPLRTPSPREIFAAFCSDRLVHHFVAPFICSIAERVHLSNGDVSHGNRIGHSAQTGAEQIRGAIQQAEKDYLVPYVVKVDIRSFFTSIPRELAYGAFEKFADTYYTGEDKGKMLALCRLLVLHNPVEGCVELPGDWSMVPAAKRVKNAKPGCGLPIGNFYSQIIANLFLALWDRELLKFGVSPRFVDDKCGIVKDRDEAVAFVNAARVAAAGVGLTMHPDKIYIQPARNGVNFCGRTIKGNRIYLSSKTINRCLYRINMLPLSQEGARLACDTANSCIGLMYHCTEYGAQKKICKRFLSRFGKWVYVCFRKGKFTCKLKREFTVRNEHRTTVNNLINIYHETCKENRRGHHPRRSGKRH